VFKCFYTYFIISVAAFTAIIVRADVAHVHVSPAQVQELKAKIRVALGHEYPSARIDLNGPIKLIRGEFPSQIRSVSLTSEPVRGEAHLLINGTVEISSVYEALMSARIAKRRIPPGQKLDADMFVEQEVNVASGLAYEMRGLILPQEEDVTRLETRQTVMEGQFLVSNAVQKIPDIRKGDSVSIHISSGKLSLTTQGFAAEPGFSDNPIKVIVAKSKRELTGELRPGGSVEVNLQ
jgi:flagella basal body P-ring formation protein FlgA